MSHPSDNSPQLPHSPLHLTLHRLPDTNPIPSHHVLAPPPGSTLTSYLPHWNGVPLTSSSSSTASQRDDNDFYNDGMGCTPFSRSGGGGGGAAAAAAAAAAWQNPTSIHDIGAIRTGFRNPWDSAAKPTLAQVWDGLEWDADLDPCIGLAREQADKLSQSGRNYRDHPETAPTGNDDDYEEPLIPSASSTSSSLVSAAASLTTDAAASAAASQLLHTTAPDFHFTPGSRSKTTWLGHASVLVQLSPLSSSSSPVRILIDPIFSTRCSPTQIAGPYRSYPPPCRVEDLPPIDVVLISHNHYDHLDLETVREVWRRNRVTVRFVVPLGNREWFLAESGVAGMAALAVDPERVVELDWWESVDLRLPTDDDHNESEGEATDRIEITCTPAQHGSGRCGLDSNVTLWSSWYITSRPSPSPSTRPHRIFFAGDTGYQVHTSPHFPPPPCSALPLSTCEDTSTPYPPCPAFLEIRQRKGRPHVSLLPISVGATISFLRSYIPLNDKWSPMPRISLGLTGGNHAMPWDAVMMLDVLTRPNSSSPQQDDDNEAIGVAIHWGTFVSGPTEVLKTIGHTIWACRAHGVRFELADRIALDGSKDAETKTDEPQGRPTATGTRFRILDHGGSISL